MVQEAVQDDVQGGPVLLAFAGRVEHDPRLARHQPGAGGFGQGGVQRLEMLHLAAREDDEVWNHLSGPVPRIEPQAVVLQPQEQLRAGGGHEHPRPASERIGLSGAGHTSRPIG